MIVFRKLHKKGLRWGFVALLALLVSSPEIGYGFHWPWDQGHDTTNPNVPPNHPPRDPRCDCHNSSGSPVFLASGRYFRTATDLRIPTAGEPLTVIRTYNSEDRYSGPFGFGWTFNFSTRLIPVSDGTTRYAIVRMPDGSRAPFRQLDSTRFSPPPGDFSTLTKRGDGTYDLVEKNGRKQTFDADGNLLAITDRNGNRLTLSYTSGFISSVTDSAGRSLRFTLGPNGKIVGLTDFANRTVAYTYDAAGHLTQVRDAAGNLTAYTYDADHNLTRITDPLNHVVAQMTYDNQGRVTRVVDAEGDISYVYAVGETRKVDNSPNPPQRGATWIYRYDSRGLINEVRDPLGGVERRVYDDNGKLTQLTDKNGVLTLYTYDAFGNLTSSTEASGRPEQRAISLTYEPVFNHISFKSRPPGTANGTRYEYDARGNLIRVTELVGEPLQRITNYEYDAAGNITRIVYPDGAAEVYTYDAAGRVLTRKDALANTTQFTYDSLSRLQCQTDPNSHKVCYEYDALDRVTAVTDANTKRTAFTYDAAGNLLTVTNAVGEVTRYTYDTFGRPLTITDPFGNVTTYTYDLHGNLTSALNANGKMVYYKYDVLDRRARVVQKVGGTADTITADDAVSDLTYDAMGSRKSLRDPNSNTTLYDYDSLRRLVRETRANNLSVTYTYDVMDSLTRIQRSDGYFRTLQYDRLNRLVQESDSLGALGTYTYDPRDRRLSVADGNGNTIQYGYNNTGQLTTVTDPLGRSARFDYDPAGNILRQVDREGRTRTYAYDALDRITSITDAVSSVSTFSYDALGRVTAMQDGNGNSTVFTYTSTGTRRVIQQTNVDGSVLQLEFDGVGNLVRRVDPNRIVTTYVYDDLNRLVRRGYPSGGDDVFAYDKGGRMLTATNANAAVGFTYDAVNRITQTTQPGGNVGYAYNQAGSERTITYPGGRQVKAVYDGRNRLLRVDNLAPTANTLAQFTYDVGNRLTSESLLNGINTGFNYDANDNVARSTAQLGSLLQVGFEYRFDREDNRLSAKRLHDTSRSERYIYDAAFRLSGFRRGVLDATGEIPSPTAQTDWTLDKVGNWSSLVRDGVTETRSHNALNQITAVSGRTLTYDANGNLLDDGINTYAYDFENRLTQVTRRSDGQVLARFRYDALKRRVAKEANGVTTTYLYDGPQVVEERQAGVPVATYVYGRNISDVLETERAGQHFYYHPNALGSIEALSDATGALIERYIYDAYGGPRFFDATGMERTTSAIGNPLLFTAQRWDAEVGLYDYWARQYHSGLGRFMQRDPLGAVARVNALNRSVFLTDEFGNTAQQYGYNLFSEVARRLPDPLAIGQPFASSGQEWDSVTSLYTDRAKYYDPAMVRWLSQDPISALQMNLYPYVGNNPINYQDPNGEFLVPIAVAVVGIGGVIGGGFKAVEAIRAGKGFGDVAAAFGKGFVSGAVGTGVGLLVGLGTKNPYLIGASTGLASNLVDQFFEHGFKLSCYSAGKALRDTALGGLTGGLIPKIPGLETHGRLPDIFQPRNIGNFGPNSLRLLGQEAANDVSNPILQKATDSQDTDPRR